MLIFDINNSEIHPMLRTDNNLGLSRVCTRPSSLAAMVKRASDSRGAAQAGHRNVEAILPLEHGRTPGLNITKRFAD